ncbi:hypothetical protein [uncultured Algoriphagus sp.]|uniref:hypothetical protein n=1 Tax=uncultured Algoriphagus sp. TaxID=417365 RepID=UPI00258DE176|nr:hypothetical protein [uncultured Algoriphagus sp.]
MKAVKNFFDLNSHLCPEAMMLELTCIRDVIPKIACECQPSEDVRVTYHLVDTIIQFIGDCHEVTA